MLGRLRPRITWDEQGLVLYPGTDLTDADARGLLLPKVSEARKARIERVSSRQFPKKCGPDGCRSLSDVSLRGLEKTLYGAA
jgi:hypothetical protein